MVTTPMRRVWRLGRGMPAAGWRSTRGAHTARRGKEPVRSTGLQVGKQALGTRPDPTREVSIPSPLALIRSGFWLVRPPPMGGCPGLWAWAACRWQRCVLWGAAGQGGGRKAGGHPGCLWAGGLGLRPVAGAHSAGIKGWTAVGARRNEREASAAPGPWERTARNQVVIFPRAARSMGAGWSQNR